MGLPSKKTAVSILIPAVMVCAGFFLSHLAPVQMLEWRSVDLRFKARGATEPDQDIVIISVDETSFKSLKLKYPFPPLLYSELIKELNDAGAAVIAFDFLYSEPTRECDPPDQDALLAKTMKEAGNVVWGMELVDGSEPNLPIPVINETLGGKGFINLPDEQDGRIRRFKIFHNGYPSFAGSILKLYAGIIPPSWENESYHIINYRGPGDTFPRISFSDILSGYVPQEMIRDKICLVGAVFAASHDLYPTPFHRADSPNTPGIEIHANILGTILKNNPIMEHTSLFHWILLAGMSLLIAILLFHGKPWISLLAWILLSTIWILGSLKLFLNNQVVFFFIPLAVMASSFWVSAWVNYFLERNRRREIRELFSSYVDPSVVNWLLKNPGQYNTAGLRCMVTVLDTDIEGFTKITSQLDPADLVNQLNQYFETVTEAALSEGGMHDKYVGDALMIIYGFPMRQEDHAIRALRAAEKIIHAVGKMNMDWASRGMPIFKTRIGICSGEVIMGNVGGTRRKTVTAMGDAANLASRIEGLNKQFDTRVLISESTARLLPDTVELKDMGEVDIRGYAHPVRLFNPLFDRSIVRHTAVISSKSED